MMSASLHLKTFAILAIVVILAPVSLLIVLVTYLANLLCHAFHDENTVVRAADRKVVLVNGGSMNKSLEVCRKLSQAGHKIVLYEVESHGKHCHAKFSSCVSAFYLVPDPTEDGGKAFPRYEDAVANICQAEKVNIYIPVSPVACCYHDALLGKRLRDLKVEIFHFSPEIVKELDEKYTFGKRCLSLDLPVPESTLVTSKQEVLDFPFNATSKRWLLKRSNWIPNDKRKLTIIPPDVTRTELEELLQGHAVGPNDPFVIQEYLVGEEYCTYAIARNGTVTAYCDVPSSDILLEYKLTDNQEYSKQMLEFTTKFARALDLTGHLSFDFIVRESDKQLIAIECNPRCHTAVMLFHNHPYLAEAYIPTLLDKNLQVPLRPKACYRPVYWLPHLVHDYFRDIQSKGGFFNSTALLVRRLLTEREGYFCLYDPLPFFMFYHYQVPMEVIGAWLAGYNWDFYNVSTSKLWSK